MQKKYDISIVMVCKNEGPYLKEWLDYHLLLGVDHFFLYDNQSTDNTLEVLNPYIEAGLVTHSILEGEFHFDSSSETHRMHAINNHGPSSSWMAFLDADEFLRVNTPENNLKQVIREFDKKQYSGVHLKSLCYGTGFLWDKNLSEPVVGRYFLRSDKVTTVKALIKPQHVNGVINGHVFKLKNGTKYMDLNTNTSHGTQKNTPGLQTNQSVPAILNKEPLVINHYFTKSVEEYTTLKNKYTKCPKSNDRYSINFLNEISKDINEVEDRYLCKFAPYIRADKILPLVDRIQEMWNTDKRYVFPFIDLVYATMESIKNYIHKHDPQNTYYHRYREIHSDQTLPDKASDLESRKELVDFSKFLLRDQTDNLPNKPSMTLERLLKTLEEESRCPTCGNTTIAIK